MLPVLHHSKEETIPADHRRYTLDRLLLVLVNRKGIYFSQHHMNTPLAPILSQVESFTPPENIEMSNRG
jgi:hypothetical protein